MCGKYVKRGAGHKKKSYPWGVASWEKMVPTSTEKPNRRRSTLAAERGKRLPHGRGGKEWELFISGFE